MRASDHHHCLHDSGYYVCVCDAPADACADPDDWDPRSDAQRAEDAAAARDLGETLLIALLDG